MKKSTVFALLGVASMSVGASPVIWLVVFGTLPGPYAVWLLGVFVPGFGVAAWLWYNAEICVKSEAPPITGEAPDSS